MVTNNKTKSTPSKWLGILLCLVVFSSCSLQKRLYTKGFYTGTRQSIKKVDKTDTLPSVAVNQIKVKNKRADLLTSKSKYIISTTNFIFDACDTIILKSGAKIIASIKDAGTTEIKYKNCSNPNSLILTLKRSDISKINYANGRKETFEEEHKFNQPLNLPGDDNFNAYANNQRSEDYKRRRENRGKTTSGFAIAGFVFSFTPLQLGLIFLILDARGNIGSSASGLTGLSPVYFFVPFAFALIAFILCLTAIIQISKNKETKKGLGMAVFGLILSIFIMFLAVALFVSFA